MAKGKRILLLDVDPKRVGEGTITDTSKPGTLVNVVAGTTFLSTAAAVPASNFIGGRPKFAARALSDGVIGPLCVLLEDADQGKTTTDAYVANTRCFVYWLMPGDEANLLLGDVAGTGDIVTEGDLFGVANGGKIKANSSYASAPFMAMESLLAGVADVLLWCKVLGVQA